MPGYSAHATEIVLVRHALPHLPPGGPDDYHRALTEQGRAQADDLVGRLATPAPSLIASSPYLRAVHTVEPLARALGLTIRTELELREWDSGLDPSPDYASQYAQSWDEPTFARPGGESLQQLSDRATAMLISLASEHRDGRLVIGSHGTFICRALTGFGLTVDWPFSQAMPMPAVYRLRIAAQGVDATGPGL